MPDDVMVQRVQKLKQTVESGRERRARAQATKEHAEQSLAALLAEHGVATVEELAAKAQEARVQAEHMLAAAEAAVAAPAQ